MCLSQMILEVKNWLGSYRYVRDFLKKITVRERLQQSERQYTLALTSLYIPHKWVSTDQSVCVCLKNASLVPNYLYTYTY